MAEGGRDAAAAYATSDMCADSLDKLKRNLSHDLRIRVRRLGHFEVLSEQWMQMADAVEHLGYEAAAEAKGNGEVARDGSAWERDELCVRYVLEEAKTNLLLRALVSLHEFKEQAAKEEKKLPPESTYALRTYEMGLGSLFRCVLGAEEAVQTLDMPMLISYCASVIELAANGESEEPGTNNVERMQAVVAVKYVRLLLEQIEKVPQEKILASLLDAGIISSVLRHHARWSESLGLDGAEMYVWLFAHLCSTEFYAGQREEFFKPGDDRQRLSALKPMIDAMLPAEKDDERRRRLRTLRDQCIRFA